MGRRSSDFGALRADGDVPAASGALDDLRVAALRVRATLVKSIVDLEAKREFLDDWSEVFKPAALLGRMVEAMVMDECRRVGATPEQVNANPRSAPRSGGASGRARVTCLQT